MRFTGKRPSEEQRFRAREEWVCIATEGKARWRHWFCNVKHFSETRRVEGYPQRGDFLSRERKDIDGYGYLMAYCSTQIALVMSLLTLSDVDAACLPCIKSWGWPRRFQSNVSLSEAASHVDFIPYPNVFPWTNNWIAISQAFCGNTSIGMHSRFLCKTFQDIAYTNFQ